MDKINADPSLRKSKPFAAIDIGTNSAHLAIATIDDGGHISLLDTDKATLRLGRYLARDGGFSELVIDQVCETLNNMKRLCASYEAPLRAVATHATREANNRTLFIERILERTGIQVEVIDGFEEARLNYVGVHSGFSWGNKRILTVDIGGGSTELAIGKAHDIKYVASVKLGAVVLTSQHCNGEKMRRADLKSLRNHVSLRLTPLQKEISNHPFEDAIASSGTAKALAYIDSAVFKGKAITDPNGYILERSDLERITDYLEELLTPKKIRRATGIEADRAEIILAGAEILNELTKQLKIKSWTISTYGLREGLIVDTWHRFGGQMNWAQGKPVWWQSVERLAKRLHVELAHARHVSELALQIYDACAEYSGFPEKLNTMISEKNLLKSASYLHECGKFLSFQGFHKHSAYIVNNSKLLGFTVLERQVVAAIIRIHRKSLALDALSFHENESKRIVFLGGILRMSTALNRTRRGLIKSVKVEIGDGRVMIHCYHTSPHFPELEYEMFRRNQNIFSECFGAPVSLQGFPLSERPIDG